MGPGSCSGQLPLSVDSINDSGSDLVSRLLKFSETINQTDHIGVQRSETLPDMKSQPGFKVTVVLGLLLILWFAGPLSANSVAPLYVGLDDFKWKNRLIVISAPSSDDRWLQEQVGLLSGQSEGIVDRDLRLVVILEQGPSRIDGSPLCEKSVKEYKTRLGISMEKFQVLLIGKDGGVKLRSSGPVSAERFYSLIDAMPMRQREMLESSDP